jgi:hypothetical protein
LAIVEVEKLNNKVFKDVEINADIIEGFIQDADIKAECNGSLDLDCCHGKLRDNLDISGSFKVSNDVHFIVQKSGSKYKIEIGSANYESNGHIVKNDRMVPSTIVATTKGNEQLQIEGSQVSFGSGHNGYVEMAATNVNIKLAHISGKLSGIFSGGLLATLTHWEGQ